MDVITISTCIVIILCVCGDITKTQDVSTTMNRWIGDDPAYEALLQKNNVTTNFVSDLLDGPDPRIRPIQQDDGPVKVVCGLHIFSFSSISELSMDYKLSVFFRESWIDPRLSYDPSVGPDRVNLQGHVYDKVWLPDIYFSNEKEAKFHDVTVPNKMTRIYPNGTVVYSLRLTLLLSCPMDLAAFPMDTQTCAIKMESYAYETHEVELNWMPKPVELDEDLQLPQFDIAHIHKDRCSKQYKTGNFSCLKVMFSLKRHYGFFLLQTYVPSILIVILSWVSFWINMDAVPARISLGVTTVLTMTTQLSGASSNIPKVSYPKAIDVWMSMCMIFVFASILEYAFVNALARKYSDDKYKKTDDERDHVEITVKSGRSFRDMTHSLRQAAQINRRNIARNLDRISRVVFPTTFFIFNIIYWPTYTTRTPRYI